jgi:ribosome-associated toxin RatA of RatAB toxin-antitoxin module
MKHVQKSVLVCHSPNQMYALVAEVQNYPQFLPWCERVEVLEQQDTVLLARLHLSYRGLRQSFTTRNTHVAGSSIELQLVDGPFSELVGSWRFKALPEADGAQAGACKVEFDLRYHFANRLLAALVSPVFDHIANTFVDSFVKRAEQLHGAR